MTENKETQFVEEMVEMFSDFAYHADEQYALSYDALSCFFRHLHNAIRDGDLKHLFNNDMEINGASQEKPDSSSADDKIKN